MPLSKQESKGACVVVFEKILDGLGMLGSQFRTAYIATSEVVKGSVYPVKENCIRRYSEANPTWESIGSKTSLPNNEIPTFTENKATESLFSQSSYRSRF